MKSICIIGLFLFSIILTQAQNREVTLNYADGTQDKRVVSPEKLLADNKIQLESGQVIDLAGLKSIEMGARVFEIKKVLIDLAQNREEVGLIPEKYTPNIRDSLMILEKFVGGKLSLYATPPEGTTFYFVEKEGKPIVELRGYITKRAKDGAILRYDIFRNTMTTFTADCPQVTADQLSKTRLFLKSLRKLVVAYNRGCGFESYIAKKENPKLVLNPGVFVSYALSSVNFNVSHTFKAHVGRVSGSAAQSGYPVGLNLKIPIGILGKVWIETTHTVSHIAGSAESVETQMNPSYSRWYYKTSFSFDANYFRNSFGLNFAISKNEKFKPFIGAGFGLNVCTTFNSSMHLSGYILDTAGQHPIAGESASGLGAYESVNKIASSLFLNAGVSYSRFTLRYHFEGQPNITSGDSFHRYRINRVALGVYLLK